MKTTKIMGRLREEEKRIKVSNLSIYLPESLAKIVIACQKDKNFLQYKTYREVCKITGIKHPQSVKNAYETLSNLGILNKVNGEFIFNNFRGG